MVSASAEWGCCFAFIVQDFVLNRYMCLFFLTESKFHWVVQRGPLRADSEAWERVSSGSYKVPTEMEAWVGAGSVSGDRTVVVKESEEVSAGASP
jgi:hypothetical protein